MLLKPETLTDLVEIIRPEMFYTRQNAQIYSEMLRLFTACLLYTSTPKRS